MTFASDQKPDQQDLAPTSRRMLALRDRVFARWEERVRAAIGEADALRHPVLVDTLPAFYDNICEAVTPGYPRADAVAGATIAAEHGGERARLSAYDHEALIGEYQILRSVILEVLQEDGATLTLRETAAIHHAIDGGIRMRSTPSPGAQRPARALPRGADARPAQSAQCRRAGRRTHRTQRRPRADQRIRRQGTEQHPARRWPDPRIARLDAVPR
ncbi:hypothetical protein G4G28_10275 [Massilia sp. Dwa41.01b]|nr:hypothetical protein [Massilia sp. Dwa41.01b]QNA88787.1 hypothetical protein G4G28_10275 [Massilia sp. Dwa41.01b]